MGYRSDVKIAMTKRAWLGLIDTANKTLEEEQAIVITEPDKIQYSTDEEVVVVSWDWIKWYAGYPEIDCIENYLDVLDEANESYEFIRIGEDYEDIETKYSCGDESCMGIISVYRNIDVDLK